VEQMTQQQNNDNSVMPVASNGISEIKGTQKTADEYGGLF
jgi:hypothetical protein